LFPVFGWRIMMRICALVFGLISIIASSMFIPVDFGSNPSFEVKRVLSVKELFSKKEMK